MEEDDQEPEDEKDLLGWAKQTQRNIDFVVNQQAQFAGDMQRSREERDEQWREQQERWKKADQRWERTESGIRALLDIARIHEQEINALREAQERADRDRKEAQAQTDRRMKETGERVDALINTMERLIGERRDGGPDAREG